MSRKIIVVTDTTSHGGQVITGSDTHTADGKKIARLDDLVNCPQHGTNKIVEASSSTTIGGRPVALDGDHTECGATLIGSVTTTVDD